ncbi:MAG: M1 family metallopeptidase [Deltaproteobacteria bacterium]|nr:M1 family metallopeptidase [Deltaproteobacteria bacterium]MBW2153209.1 M1 family metallopeptidase [Deltaproteobacteria bacterium]
MNPNPINYRLHLEPNLEDFTFYGNVEILLELPTPASTIRLNALELSIQDCSIQKDNTHLPCAFQVDGENEQLLILLPGEMTGTVKVNIGYTGQINDKMAGFYRSAYGPETNRKYIATTQFEERDARRAFPCLDHPRYKATFDVEIIIDEFLTAISNTPVKKVKPERSGKVRVCFQSSSKMSTYLVFFAVGDFKIQSSPLDSRVRIVTLPGREADTNYVLSFGSKALRFCEDYFDISYPLEKMDMIAIPDFAFGAMENWGAITFRENLLLYYPNITSKVGEERICEVIAHEIVHQWFGNLVTPLDWKYLWLNASFATFFGYGVVDHYNPQWNIWDQFISSMTEAALERDSLSETFSIEIPGDDHVVINAATAPIIYNKGANILRQLKEYIGEKRFRQGLQEYLKSYQYGCAASHHLWEAFQRVSDGPVSKMMKGWIEQPGFPVIDVHRHGDSISLAQRRLSYLPNDSTHTWLIPITIQTFDASLRPETTTILMENKMATIPIGEKTIAYKINYGQTGFYRTRYRDSSNLKALGSFVLQQRLPAINRWGIENDLFAFVKSGDIPMDQYLNFIAENFQQETAFLPISSIAGNLYSAYLVAEEGLRQRIATVGKSLLENVLDRIGYEPTSDEPHACSVLRDRIIWHALVYGTKPMEAFAQRQVNRLLKDQTIHPDIQKSIMQATALLAGERAYGWLKQRFQTSKSEHERLNLLLAMGCFKDKDLIESALMFALNEVPARNKFIPIVSATDNPHAISFLWEWYLSHLKELESFHPLLYERVLAAIIPVCALKAPDSAKAFFNDYIKTHHNLKDTIRMSLERLEINLRLKGSG